MPSCRPACVCVWAGRGQHGSVTAVGRPPSGGAVYDSARGGTSRPRWPAVPVSGVESRLAQKAGVTAAQSARRHSPTVPPGGTYCQSAAAQIARPDNCRRASKRQRYTSQQNNFALHIRFNTFSRDLDLVWQENFRSVTTLSHSGQSGPASPSAGETTASQ